MRIIASTPPLWFTPSLCHKIPWGDSVSCDGCLLNNSCSWPCFFARKWSSTRAVTHAGGAAPCAVLGIFALFCPHLFWVRSWLCDYSRWHLEPLGSSCEAQQHRRYCNVGIFVISGVIFRPLREGMHWHEPLTLLIFFRLSVRLVSGRNGRKKLICW